ncbi:D-alanyl-D-alanine carboxypeptidase family protein [Blastococcus sp. VKM Ac-2987]|uniref:D-alanyl-D-alanine carboxypeptidase family protein n=1 Tax=Blastococcus sp. VKM Ac-2987 TaxID=3004141 RepID=UPI0022AB5621|nr:D-alanyl-D-alanine carboxypeptidase family protein [Blastococcus sp. VKM Ac-2987]MCZ2857129.1 D-alanyl-D-alanine carboxypeptidase family protein [Blastococcus sp. VKM Ac-2987]
MLARTWSRRTAAARGRTAGAVLAACAVVLLPAGPVAAAPSDQPGGTSGVLDSGDLDHLQRRAAEVQQSLRARQAEVVAARAALADAQAEVEAARAVLADAQGVLDGYQGEVAGYASAVYRDGGAVTPLILLLRSGDPAEVLSALGFLDAVDAHAAEVVAIAEGHRREALDHQQRARSALEQAQARADEVTARVAELQAAADAVTAELEEALQVVDGQLSRLQREQVDVNEQTAASWRAYVDQLRAAGVDTVPAAALGDPARGLPDRLVPVGATGGGAQRGVAQLPGQPTSLLVLPAETLTAVSAAMEALGRPYAPGTAGPDSWDCGTLVQSAFRRAGVPLPATQGELFATATPVAAADVLPGDLVFLGSGEAGLGHVGIALDQRTMVAADARAGVVVVRTLPADQVLAVGRAALGRQPAVPVPGPAAGALRTECGNTVHPPSFGGARAWGGYPNGLIPPSAMCPLGVAGHVLRCDAAAAYRALSSAYAADFDAPLCITDSYRTYAGQVRLYGQKPALAAVPGTSNHGWGLAVDLCGGVQTFGTPQYAWMVANAGRFGFLHPTWADPGNGREEPWHWEYAGT